MTTKNRKFIYHLTDLENLQSIITHGLVSRSELNSSNMAFSDIANRDIIEKRHALDRNDAVLFHFLQTSDFDTAVKNKHSDKNFIYLSMWRNKAKEYGFKIFPKHPLHGDVEPQDYEIGYEMIDWELMDKTKLEYRNELENAGLTESEISQKLTEHHHTKMAECISPNSKVTFDKIDAIFCNREMYGQVCALLRKNGIIVDAHVKVYKSDYI